MASSPPSLQECVKNALDSESDPSDSGDNNQQPTQPKCIPSMWDAVPIIQAKVLPEGVDGLVAFDIEDIPPEDLKNALEDGRKWNKNCPSKWNGHKRVRYDNFVIVNLLCLPFFTKANIYVDVKEE